MAVYRFSRWHGSQAHFPLREDDLMERLSDQLMANGDVSCSLAQLAFPQNWIQIGGPVVPNRVGIEWFKEVAPSAIA